MLRNRWCRIHFGSAPGTPTVEIHNCYVAADIQGNDKIGGLVGSEEGHEKFNDTGDSYGIKGANSISDNLFMGLCRRKCKRT